MFSHEVRRVSGERDRSTACRKCFIRSHSVRSHASSITGGLVSFIQIGVITLTSSLRGNDFHASFRLSTIRFQIFMSFSVIVSKQDMILY